MPVALRDLSRLVVLFYPITSQDLLQLYSKLKSAQRIGCIITWGDFM